MDFPRHVKASDAARALNCIERTAKSIAGLPTNRKGDLIPYRLLCRSVECTPEFLMACLHGHDRALTVNQAAKVLGLTPHQLTYRTANRFFVQPSARLRKGLRFSRNLCEGVALARSRGVAA